MCSARNEPEWYKQGIYDVVRLYFKVYYLVQHQIDSYHWFTDHAVPQYVENYPPIEMTDSLKKVKHTVKFTNFHMKKPSISEYESAVELLTPMECRRRNFSYSSKSYMTLVHTTSSSKETKTEVIKNIPIGEIPIMLRSNKCVLCLMFSTLIFSFIPRSSTKACCNCSPICTTR